MISRSVCVNWVSCLGYKVCFGLDVIHIPYVFLLVMSIAMGAAFLASPTATQRDPHSLDATRTSRKAAKSSRSLGLRLQRVDGRRFDALVADILRSRLHGVAAPTVSYVSAPLVRRASVHLCECVCSCALLPVRADVLVAVPDFVCMRLRMYVGQRARTVEPSGVLEL